MKKGFLSLDLEKITVKLTNITKSSFKVKNYLSHQEYENSVTSYWFIFNCRWKNASKKNTKNSVAVELTNRLSSKHLVDFLGD